MRVLSVVLLGGVSAMLKSYAGYSVHRVTFDSVESLTTTLDHCHETGECDVWAHFGLQADLCVNASLPSHLNSSLLIRDVELAFNQSMQDVVLTADPFFSNYQRYDDVRTKVKSIAAASPGAEYIPSIGQTAGKRDIFGISIGGGTTPKATIYIQGGIHAREWISPATVMFILNSLTTSSDPAVKALLERIQIVVVPLLNADGYEYCFTNDRLWRKNRAVNAGSSCVGVDLNRNWGDHWGGPGSSSSPCSETYHGASAFSELESSAVRDFWAKRQPPAAFIDFHSYGQLMLRPYGWQTPNKGTPPNEAEVKALTEKMVAAIKATHGKVYTNEHAAELYVACGGADDWFYSVGTKGGVSLTIELRDTGANGFTLPPAQIIPTGEEAYAAFLVLAQHILQKHV